MGLPCLVYCLSKHKRQQGHLRIGEGAVLGIEEQVAETELQDTVCTEKHCKGNAQIANYFASSNANTYLITAVCSL